MTYEEKISTYLHKIRHHFTPEEYKRIKNDTNTSVLNKDGKITQRVAQLEFERINK